MLRGCLAVLLAFQSRPVFAAALKQLNSAVQTTDYGAFFDGNGSIGGSLPVRAGKETKKATRVAAWDYQTLREAKDLLSRGTQQLGAGPILPFTFNFKEGGAQTARSAGLEGFVYAEWEISQTRGSASIEHHVQDYIRYVDALLAPVSWAADARAALRQIDQAYANPREKYEKVMEFVRGYTESLRQAVKAADGAAWVRGARIYEIFPRAYNLQSKRENEGSWKGGKQETKFFADFADKDLADIRDKGFDTLWVMGIFPIGEKGRTGTGGGSPYSIKDHSAVNPDLGSPDDFRAFVARAHRLGMRVIMDFVPNHTSMDSKMLDEHPDYFINRPAQGDTPPDGYFLHQDKSTGKKYWIRHGGMAGWGGKRDYWIDTAQVDYSNPMFRQEMVRTVGRWVEKYGVDGFRVDMAYLVTNAYFGGTWGNEAGSSMPQREFLEELITEVKSRYPQTAFIAESYDRWDDLSSAGFDLIYGKNNMDRPGGHHGWFDAVASKDPGWIREALKRSEFLQWQAGGSDMLEFIGNHDESSPARVFGSWQGGAAFLTLLMPGSKLFYGSAEIGYDAAVPTDGKPLPFSVPVAIDWSKADPDTTRFYNETFQAAQQLKAELGEMDMEVLRTDTAWVGYVLRPKDAQNASRKAAVVIANPTDRTVSVSFKAAGGIEYNGSLPPYGYALLRY